MSPLRTAAVCATTERSAASQLMRDRTWCVTLLSLTDGPQGPETLNYMSSIYPHIHTHTHAHTHKTTHKHTLTDTDSLAYTIHHPWTTMGRQYGLCVRVCVRVCVCVCKQTHTHTHTQSYADMYETLTNTHTHMITHTNTHTHTHTHAEHNMQTHLKSQSGWGLLL